MIQLIKVEEKAAQRSSEACVLLNPGHFILQEQWSGCSGGSLLHFLLGSAAAFCWMITDVVMTGRKECVSNAAWNLHMNWTKRKDPSLTAYMNNTAVITRWRHHQNAVGGASCRGETEVTGQRRAGRPTCPGRFPSNESGWYPAEEEVLGPVS